MPIQVASNLIPKSGAKWPVVEDVYVKGGLRVVADAATRDSLYTDSTAKLGLKNGMLLITADDNRIWQYLGTGTWVELKKANSFTYTQVDPSDTWIVNHGAHSTSFTFSLFDADGFLVLPNECQILDVDNLKLTFLQAIAGTVTLTFNV
jgi:hypothetical protein